MQIAGSEGGNAAGVQKPRLRHDEVHPPHAEGEPGARDSNEDCGHTPPYRDETTADGDPDGADDAFAPSAMITKQANSVRQCGARATK